MSLVRSWLVRKSLTDVATTRCSIGRDIGCTIFLVIVRLSSVTAGLYLPLNRSCICVVIIGHPLLSLPTRCRLSVVHLAGTVTTIVCSPLRKALSFVRTPRP